MGTLISAERVFGHNADAVLVEGGRVAAVGWRAEMLNPTHREERFPGGTIIAGLTDAHFHPIGYTGALHRLVLKEATDFDDLNRRLAASARDLPPGATLVGIRLDDESLAEGRLPTRQLIDRAVPDRPVLLFRYCGHIAVANTTALAAAGIGPGTPDPAGGSLDRDESGLPTGVLRETAIGPVAAAVGNRAVGLTPDQVAEATRLLARTGLTGLGAIVMHEESLLCEGIDEFQLLVDAAPELALPMTVFVGTEAPDGLEKVARRLVDAGPQVRFGGVKLFADGSLGGRTAALRLPYADRPDTKGTHRLPASVALPVAQRALDLEGRVAIHAIGDEAVSRVLDIFEHLVEVGADPSRLRIEHASVVTEADLERMAALGIIASVQPAFLASEARWLPVRLGARIADTYRFRSMLEAGVPLAGGSDCPVEPPHPLHGIAAAVDRHGIVPDEALTPAAAVEMFTTGAARALGTPPPLSSGSPAHLTIVDGDLSAMTAAQIRRAEVLATFVNGATVPLPESVVDWQG